MDSQSPFSASSSESDSDDPRPVGRHDVEERFRSGGRNDILTGSDWVQEIVAQLEDDPAECWQALESFASLERDVRVAVIEALSEFRQNRGVGALLRLLSSMRESRSRPAPRSGLESSETTASDDRDVAALAAGDLVTTSRPPSLPMVAMRSAFRLQSCAVTPVDGHGRGSVVISVEERGQRRTAAFLCDVQRGIIDVVGEVEPISPGAGGLLDELIEQSGVDCVCDVPALALGLLAGSLTLGENAVPSEVRDWLDGTLGTDFQPAALPAAIAGFDPASIPDAEMSRRARLVLDACPSWLDCSPLTFELAEEIRLREGRLTVDPDRDAGAYRFLFEHRLVHRLELYRRMHLWMVRLWHCGGQEELWQSALALAYQLSDEQYAVPSHPFTLWLTTRSLEAAQSRLRTTDDPRWNRA